VAGAAAAGYFFYLAPQAQRKAYVAEEALPAATDADYTITLKLKDMGFLETVIDETSTMISEFWPTPDNASGPRGAADVVSTLNSLSALLGTVSEMSILVAPRQGAHTAYISLIADGTAFSSVMAELRPNVFYTLEKWDAGMADSEGWRVKNPNGFNMYILKRQGTENSQILAAATEQAISDMVSAADGKSPRFSPERTTSGPDFLQVRMKNGFTYGMLYEIVDTMVPDIAGRKPSNSLDNLIRKNSDQVFFTVYEFSAAKSGNVITSETYSDVLEKNPGLAARHPKSAAEPRLMGDGELACFLAFDTGFILSSILPGVEDPVQALFDALGPLPPGFMFSGDLKAILSSARISIACIINDKKINNVYALMETDASESLDKLFSMIGVLGLLPGAKLQGWDSAFSAPVPTPDAAIFPSGFNAVLAHKKGVLLAGIGKTAVDFDKSPSVRKEYGEFLSKDNIVGCVVSSKLYDMQLDTLRNYLAAHKDVSSEGEALIDMITTVRDSFDFAGTKLSASGRSYFNISMAEGKSPTKLWLAPLMTGMKLLAAPSATDSAEATRIINDLRNLKSASLLHR
jgi:hypothetical protein